MTERDFCYWLKGFFELISVGPKTSEKLVLTVCQVEMIEKHLKSVFTEDKMIHFPGPAPEPPFPGKLDYPGMISPTTGPSSVIC